MKFREVLRFELAYQFRRPWPWLFFAALFVISFLVTRDGTLAEALHDDFFINSPFAVAKTTIVGGLLWLLIAGAIAGEAASRDVATGMYHLSYSLPLSRRDYLGGKFAAALLLNAFILTAVQLGVMVAVYFPGVDPALIGPFRPLAYLNAYCFLSLPNVLFVTALQFAIALRSGRPLAAFLGGMFIFFMSYIVGLFLLFQGRQGLANLLDPVGVHFILSELSHLWTTTEKSWRLLSLEGTVLTNRTIWTSFGVLVAGISYATFRFAHRTETGVWIFFLRKKPRIPEPTESSYTAPVYRSAATFQRKEGAGRAMLQLLSITRASFQAIALSWGGLFLLVVVPLLTIPVVIDGMESNGVPLIPKTMLVILEITAPLHAEISRWVIVPIMLAYFAGIVVWRERDARISELTDTMPIPAWIPMIGKLSGLSLVVVAFMVMLMLSGMAAQGILGYTNFEPGVYLTTLFLLQLPEYLLFAVLVFVIHTIANQKYAGHLAAIMAYAMITLAPMFGLEHDLFIYGAGPAWSYTDIRGFGGTIEPWLWFKLYWAAWALLFVTFALFLWPQGKELSWKLRFQTGRQRFSGTAKVVTIASVTLVVATGSFVFYNTNILNNYTSQEDEKSLRAEYERRYGKYSGIAQPAVMHTDLRIDIDPALRRAAIIGSYQLVNQTKSVIDSVHIATPVSRTTSVTSDTKVAKIVDGQHHHIILLPAKPLQPGDTMLVNFKVQLHQSGFTEHGIDMAVTKNGSYFTSQSCLPAIGYQRNRELTGASDRRVYGLKAKPLIPSLYDPAPRMERAAPSSLHVVMSTAGNQLAVAPGALQRRWIEGDRNFFEYHASGPIGNEWAFFSADYNMHEEQWINPDSSGQVVQVRIFNDPAHQNNVDKIRQSVRASLDYYSKTFGPYQHNHLTVVERPGQGMGMHADATMIIHQEGFTLWNPENLSRNLDLPYAIVAHEMAHQWTVPYAAVEGAPVMSESVAWYYGMRAVEHVRGDEQLRQLLWFMHQPHPYPVIRRGEPLLRGLDPHLSYRRGPFALYTMSQYVGADTVNHALRQLLSKHRSPDAPLATTLDLYAELQRVTPDSTRQLLHDLFEVNAFWDLQADRASARETVNGQWEVTLDVTAKKVVADSAGVETEVPVTEWLEVGAYTSMSYRDVTPPLYLARHRITAGKQTIRFMLPHQPVTAGIDPNLLMIDVDPFNNRTEVKIETANAGKPK